MREIERLGSAAIITIKVSPIKRDWMQAFALFRRVTGESLLRKRIEKYVSDSALGLILPFDGSRKQEIPANAVSYNIRVEQDSHARFIAACKNNGITPSLVIRNWIDEIAAEAIESQDCQTIDEIRRTKAEKSKQATKKQEVKQTVSAKPQTRQRAKSKALGLKGSKEVAGDRPILYIKAKDFKPGYEGFDDIASKDGGYPIYESWITQWSKSEAASQCHLDYDGILALVEKAALWQERNEYRRKTVRGLTGFLNGWILKHCDELRSGRLNYQIGAPQETKIDKINNAFARYMTGDQQGDSVQDAFVLDGECRDVSGEAER